MIRPTSPAARRSRRGLADLKPVYRAADVEGLAHLDGLPGEAPFVRGPYPTMYRERPWTLRQYAGYRDAADSNACYRRLLADGGQGLSVAFDLPTHHGYDADDPRIAADVGRAGVSVCCVGDMVRLFDGIPLDRVSVSMTMSAAVLPVLGAFLLAAERQGVPAQALRGTIQNDILKEFQARNAWIHAPGPSLRIALDVVEWLAAHAPHFNALSASGYHFQETGADAVTELALTFANARACLRGLRARGHAVDAICRRFSFFFGAGLDFYVEIAKLRAARLVWAGIVEAEGGRDPAARALRMHCQTSGWSLAAGEPYNNLMRTTVEALAAVFGGTQSLHTNACDEALCLPGEATARLARNTQLILQRETGICDVADPWAGSYLIEHLTADIAARTHARLDAIEAAGGVLALTRDGTLAAGLREAGAALQASIDDGSLSRLGESGPAPFEPRAFDGAALLHERRRTLARLRRQRDAAAHARAIAALTATARGDGNLLAATLDALRAGATLGECTQALETVWPRHRPPPPAIPQGYGPMRSTDPAWAATSAAVARLNRRRGRPVRVALVKLGLDGHDRGLLSVASALSAAGFAVSLGPLFTDAAEAAGFIAAAGADLAGVSTLAGAHLEQVPALLERLPPGLPLVVGGIVPPADAHRLQALGVAAVFGPGSSMDAIIARLLTLLDAGSTARPQTPRPAAAAGGRVSAAGGPMALPQ